jgi:ubiquinone/menaquinone biosynthesis C-methylase UbiE
MRLLDCGCGPGTITVGLADAVAPGEVVGIDNGSEQIELARSHAAENNVSNVTFQVASIHEIPFPDESFDAVISHNVLEHLEEPMAALKEANRVLKPGGVIGVRDMDADGMIFSPPTPMLKESVEVNVKIWESSSGSPRMGKTLRSLLQQTGFIDVQATGSYESFGTPESLKRICDMMVNQWRTEGTLVAKAIESGLADEATLEGFALAWSDLGNDPNGFLGNAHCEAVGWKA